jgi:mRNA-degrading endonuclease RelE of RelBE toxin-antitoxin system
MVEEIESILFTKKFKKAYQKLPSFVQKVFDEKLDLMLNDILHPSLRIKRIQGTNDKWEGSVSMKYRFTFEIQEKVLIFRTIGTHDILKRES